MKHIPIFKVLTLAKLEIIAEALEVKKYEQGDIIFEEGDVGSEFYIIKKGSVDILFGGKVVKTKHEND